MIVPDTSAKELQPRARSGRFDDRAHPRMGALELLGDRRRERIDRRGADDLDLLALGARAPRLLAAGGERQRGCRRKIAFLLSVTSIEAR
jgi:hypothetical protein